jgi:formylglycine-generating enzyme required for sulfatase activity
MPQTSIALLLALVLGQRGEDGEPRSPRAPAWSEVIEWRVDPTVVTSADLRHAIDASGLPWRVRDKRTRMELLLVPPAVLQPVADSDASDHGDRSVTGSPFYLGRFEVTQQQWSCLMEIDPSAKRSLMDDRSILATLKETGLTEAQAADMLKRFPAVGPSDGVARQQLPVHNVSRDDCMEFCGRGGFRLPTEEEWCAVVAADATSEWRSKLGERAWHRGNSDLAAHAVGEKSASSMGFYDLLGNVWEWCAPANSSTIQAESIVDDSGRVRSRPGTRGVLRGGGWFTRPAVCDPTSSLVYETTLSNVTFGLRVARDP